MSVGLALTRTSRYEAGRFAGSAVSFDRRITVPILARNPNCFSLLDCS